MVWRIWRAKASCHVISTDELLYVSEEALEMKKLSLTIAISIKHQTGNLPNKCFVAFYEIFRKRLGERGPVFELWHHCKFYNWLNLQMKFNLSSTYKKTFLNKPLINKALIQIIQEFVLKVSAGLRKRNNLPGPAAQEVCVSATMTRAVNKKSPMFAK